MIKIQLYLVLSPKSETKTQVEQTQLKEQVILPNIFITTNFVVESLDPAIIRTSSPNDT